MRKPIIILCLIGSALLIFQSLGIFDSFLLLLTDGILPGTNAVISPMEMLIVCSLLLVLVLSIVTLSTIVHYISVNRLAKKYMLKKKRSTQKRRYSRA